MIGMKKLSKRFAFDYDESLDEILNEIKPLAAVGKPIMPRAYFKTGAGMDLTKVISRRVTSDSELAEAIFEMLLITKSLPGCFTLLSYMPAQDPDGPKIVCNIGIDSSGPSLTISHSSYSEDIDEWVDADSSDNKETKIGDIPALIFQSAMVNLVDLHGHGPGGAHLFDYKIIKNFLKARGHVVTEGPGINEDNITRLYTKITPPDKNNDTESEDTDNGTTE